MTTIELIKVFEDTQKIILENDILRQKTEKSINNTKIYDKGFFAPNRTVKSSQLNIEIAENSTFNTARTFTEGKVAVLNFANPHEAGGGTKRGSRAQEESLCRCSNLYNVLSTENLFENYYSWQKKNTDYLFSDKVVYSPEIQVLKSDDYAALDEAFTLDVITCAAPYNVYGHALDVLENTYKSRIVNILESAIDNNVDVIILGAFGCGVFRNPPALMAKAFRDILVDGGYYKFFSKVVFAIISLNSYNRNLEIFKEQLLQ